VGEERAKVCRDRIALASGEEEKGVHKIINVNGTGKSSKTINSV